MIKRQLNRASIQGTALSASPPNQGERTEVRVWRSSRRPSPRTLSTKARRPDSQPDDLQTAKIMRQQAFRLHGIGRRRRVSRGSISRRASRFISSARVCRLIWKGARNQRDDSYGLAPLQQCECRASRRRSQLLVASAGTSMAESF